MGISESAIPVKETQEHGRNTCWVKGSTQGYGNTLWRESWNRKAV
jgi:hypothetical protein